MSTTFLSQRRVNVAEHLFGPDVHFYCSEDAEICVQVPAAGSIRVTACTSFTLPLTVE